MSTRKLMDCVDLDTNEKVYPITHAKAVYTKDGKTLQEKFDNGEYVDEAQVEEMLKDKQDVIEDLSSIREGAAKGATAIQQHQDISGKLDKKTAEETYQPKISDLDAIRDGAGKGATALQSVPEGYAQTLSFTNLSAASWVEDSTYADYGYRCDVACAGVTADDYAEVVFDVTQATSGAYAPICETKTNAVAIWSSENTSITIPTIIITR